jgi:hydrogenase expression/formation protein HypE
VNDLAVMGATKPLGLTSAIVIEAGFPLDDLARIAASMVVACREAGTTVVAGDTKVMGRGELDGIVITTTGIGLAKQIVTDCGLRAGDVVIVTGFIADHGLAVMARRHKLEFDTPPHSDVAPLNALVEQVIDLAGDAIAAMKDPTRGGVASALHEMAEKSGVGIDIDEAAVPLTPAARAVSELLGLDPLHVANEGKVLIGVSAAAAERVLDCLRRNPLGVNAAIIGRCVADHPGMLVVDTGLGRRLLAEPEGELLPRIC